jgi:DNA polymerase IV
MGRSADVPRSAGRTDGDDSGCSVLHVDMDAFYASVEVRRRPHLRGQPVIVGGSQRGVVAAASYEARRFGVRSAMPMVQARRLCPHAVVLPPDMAAYAAASATVMGILRDVTPLVEPLSLDEAFLDVSGAIRRLGRPAVIAAAIKDRVASELGVTCSVGVAATKFVAKLASARCKPDGLLVVPAAETLAFLQPLPVTVLWGVGARTADALYRLGIRTVGDLAEVPADALRRAVGVAQAEHLGALARGLDPRPVQERDVEKSISADNTTATDLTGLEEVSAQLLRLSEHVAGRLRQRHMVAQTVGIKVRFADFHTVGRVRTLPGWTDATDVIYRAVLGLYRSLDLDQPRIRLLGVRGEKLRDTAAAAEQLVLDLPAPQAQQPVPSGTAVPRSRRRSPDRAVDWVRARFGSGAVQFGTLLPPGSPNSLGRAGLTGPGNPLRRRR